MSEKFLIHGRSVRLHYRDILRNKNMVIAQEANWIEFDAKTGTLRVALNGSHTVRFQVTRTTERNSRSVPGQRRINFHVVKKNPESVYSVGVLLSVHEEAELEKYISQYVQIFHTPALLMKRETTFGLEPPVHFKITEVPDKDDSLFDALFGSTFRDTRYDEKWRYNGGANWRKRRIKNNRPTTGTYIIVAPGSVSMFEYESRTIAKQYAEQLVKEGAPHATVAYVSASYMQGKAQWIERETSRYD